MIDLPGEAEAVEQICCKYILLKVNESKKSFDPLSWFWDL